MRILIVDDRPLTIEVLRGEILEEEPSYEVDGATTAEEALRRAQEAQPPYDVFLLDQKLDQQLNGIDLLVELRHLSPRSDAMVITGFSDPREGQRAINAGACDYFTKPVDQARLLAQLRRLQRERGTRAERDWLATLADVGRELQAAATVTAVGRIIVKATLQLGFARARLWLYQPRTQEIVGLCQYGNVEVEEFEGLTLPLSSMPFSQAALVGGEPVSSRPSAYEPADFEQRFAASGSTAVVGERIDLPLLVGERQLGVLTLDSDAHSYVYRPEQSDLLGIFGAHAAVALGRAVQEEEEEQRAKEYHTLSEIGRHITTQAAQGNLEKLLDEVRNQVGTLLGVENFMVVLLDHETQTLDFRRQYEGGQLVNRHWRDALAGITGHIIALDQPRLIQDTKDYCEKYGVGQFGPPAACWLGVPLRTQAGVFGALVVQDYQNPGAYTSHSERVLAGVAEQVAGAIHMAYRLERQSEQEQQARSLALLGEALPRLAQESEDNFWHAALTTITHREGLSFNRAALFWFDSRGLEMHGRMGIGYFSRCEAQAAWEEDATAGRTLQQYLDKPYLARIKPTPLEQAIVHWIQETNNAASPCRALRTEGIRRRLSSDKLKGYLPPQLLHVPDLLDDAATYPVVLVPVKFGLEVLGVLAVDNAFDGEPLRESDMDKVEQLLRETMQVWQHTWLTGRHSQRFGQVYQDILALGRRITAQATTRPLKESLTDLCRSVQDVTAADCVAIYPLGPGGSSYDLGSVAYVGLQHEAEMRPLERVWVQGVSFYILQSGVLAVPDVNKSELLFGGRTLAEHRFLRREQIAALIGVPIREAASGESLGIIYFDYRSPKQFMEQDVALAEHIAGIASTAISYFRGFQHETQNRAAAEAGQRKRQQEMQIFSKIQAQALSSDSDEKQVIRSILLNARELFGRAAKLTLALLEWEQKDAQMLLQQREYNLSALGKLQSRTRKVGHGLAGTILAGEQLHKAQHELAYPIRLDERNVGALLIQKQDKQETFDHFERETIERLTTVVALALDNTRSRGNLRLLSLTISALSDPRGLSETLQAIVASARKMAPDVDCVTLWYCDADDPRKLIAGPHWGVRESGRQRYKFRHRHHPIREIMQRDPPFWESEEVRNGILKNSTFARDQGIAAVAAFPLRFGQESDALGALFLNYRQPHKFTATERILFPILANASATAIRVAQATEKARREQERFAAAVEVATTVGATFNIDDLLRKILSTLRDRFVNRDADYSVFPYIMLYDKVDRVLVLPPVAKEFYTIDNNEYKSRARLPLDGLGITCRVARKTLANGRMVIENVPNVLDREQEPDYVETRSPTRSELCFGLIREGELLGVLVLKSSKAAAFSQADERLCELVAHQVAVALERANQVAEKRASDYVTGAMAWAADVAHDINVDVSYIRYRSHWLYEAVQDEQQKLWANEIAVRAGELADKARDDRSERNKDAVLLSSILEKKVQGWRVRVSPDTEICYEWGGDAEMPVLVYPEQVWKAVRHLLRNAIDAMDHKGRIVLRLQPCGNSWMELQVENFGPDIPPEVRQRLFREPFSTKATKSNGGMGLLIAKMLIENMGGEIGIMPPQPNRGPVFVIRLPQA